MDKNWTPSTTTLRVQFNLSSTYRLIIYLLAQSEILLKPKITILSLHKTLVKTLETADYTVWKFNKIMSFCFLDFWDRWICNEDNFNTKHVQLTKLLLIFIHILWFYDKTIVALDLVHQHFAFIISWYYLVVVDRPNVYRLLLNLRSMQILR